MRENTGQTPPPPKKDTFHVVNGKLSTKHIPYIILNTTFITFSIKALTFNMEF